MAVLVSWGEGDALATPVGEALFALPEPLVLATDVCAAVEPPVGVPACRRWSSGSLATRPKAMTANKRAKNKEPCALASMTIVKGTARRASVVRSLLKKARRALLVYAWSERSQETRSRC